MKLVLKASPATTPQINLPDNSSFDATVAGTDKQTLDDEDALVKTHQLNKSNLPRLL